MNDAPVQTTNYVADPGRIADLARRIREGELSPADLVRGCLDRMKVTEPVVEAWLEDDQGAVVFEGSARELINNDQLTASYLGVSA